MAVEALIHAGFFCKQQRDDACYCATRTYY